MNELNTKIEHTVMKTTKIRENLSEVLKTYF